MRGKGKKKGRRGTRLVAENIVGINWVMLIYFCSGICSLIDEVVWVRLLKLTLGNTVYASSIVVSVFMGGLALGALLMGRYADRARRRLRLYAMLEVCATISAISLPWILRLADGAYRWFFLKYQPSPTGLRVVQVTVSAVILLIPTMIMGSTLPLLGRYVTALQERVGRLVGRLYALNMLGAALGCFLAGFVLIRMVGVMGTLYVAAGVNMLVALGGWVLSRFYEVTGESAVKSAIKGQRPAAIGKEGEKKSYLLILAFFVSGLISISYELIWMRSLAIPIGSFTYVFSAVLTIYLLGNVAGAWIGSRLSRRLKRPAVGFGVSLTCVGILGIAYIPWLCVWDFKVAPFIITTGGLLKNYGFRAMGLPIFYSVFLFLAPSIMMGIGFPLALQAWSNYRHKVGQTTGTVYGANTIGAVLGGVVTGFLLIPLVGVQLSITVLGIIGIWLGATMVQVFAARLKLRRRMGYLAVAVGLTVVAVIIPAGLFEQNIIDMPDSEVLAVLEGATTTVAVERNMDGSLELASEGIGIAGDDNTHRVAQKMLGHLAVLLNTNAKEVLSIGFGGGETTACLAQHSLNRIDCVEVAPEVVQVALKFFEHINLGERLSQKVNMMYMDGKNYLHLTDRHYDVIINGADIPAYSGSAPMFAKEHFQSAIEHLNPGGLFMTKLHLDGSTMSKPNFDSILGTFLEVYPHVTIWFPTTRPIAFFYLIGSHQEQFFSPKYIEEQLKRENVLNSVTHLNFNNNLDVLSCYIGDENDIKKYLKEFRINSDYTPYVEFNLNQVGLMREAIVTQFIETVRRNSLINHIDWTGMPQGQQEKWRRDHKLIYNVSTYLLKAYGEQNNFSRLQNIFDGLSIMPEHAALLEKEDECLSSVELAINSGLADEVIAGIDRLLRRRPKSGAAWLIKSWALQQKNKMKKALSAAKKALQYAGYNTRVQNNLGKVFLKLGLVDEAIAHYSMAVRLKPNEPKLHYNLGIAFSQQGRLDQARAQFRQELRIQPHNGVVHVALGAILAQQGNLEEAIRHYTEALRFEPDWAAHMNNLAWIFATHKEPGFRNPREAVRLSQRACQLTKYKNPGMMDTLAAAYAAADKFPKAIKTAQKAIQLAVGLEQKDLAAEIQSHLLLYKAGRPYRQP